MVELIVAVGFLIVTAVGAVVSMYWSEIIDWCMEQIEKSPHQIVRKWKSKYYSTIHYHWECSCGKNDWSLNKSIAYSDFVNHRKKERREAKMEKTVEETEGW